ncbi:MAG: bifunctional 5,10-methylenetetrahydrofolate dehydrogenase/5,10-methenyltetrahydrofolate cyclohydrolase [Candidatus Lokiarchaeota archaeon]|nr:bifunctional 5,10-methylenetetrahydrofolate dehydrogenase/5,10-methenyltetrahydrofolate cyclohydrolase [Candidatus Lokiarchaeota archaeon]
MSEDKIINGTEMAQKIKDNIKNEINSLKSKIGRAPSLVTILIGNDPGSKVYVNLKQKACLEVGIASEKLELDADISENKLINIINEYNKKNEIDGILIQLPLPSHLNPQKIMRAIEPTKDIDGFHPINTGLLANGDEKNSFIPCTPKGMIYILEKITDLKGKDVVIVNHSPLIGRPLTMLLLNRNATVKICHEFTRNFETQLSEADIIITAVGIPNLITTEMVKKNAIILDAGFSRVEGKIKGDVEFDKLISKIDKITPPTGGIGPMTIAMLLENTLISYKKRNSI